MTNSVKIEGPSANLSQVALWLLHDGWRYTNYRLLFEEIARRLTASGVPLWRMGAYIPTIDPEIFGDAFLWRREEGRARYTRAPYSLLAEDEFKRSPLHEMARTRLPFRRRLAGAEALLDFPLMIELQQAGGTDYLGLPLPFADETPVQITFATDRAGGFSDQDIQAMADVAIVLARVAEGFAVRIRVERLLNTYLGRDAGKRVMAGQILRGTGDTMAAAILFADLRGFTALSERMERDDLLSLLNAYFDLVARAVERHQGEILKFMGDGVMAVFPVGNDRTMATAARAALLAAAEAKAAFSAWNEKRQRESAPELGFGIALHAGEVMYGNVGASNRLDFTVIGPVVNMVSRLQSLCRELDEPIVISGEIARHSPTVCRSLGFQQLRGISRPMEVFAPAPAGR